MSRGPRAVPLELSEAERAELRRLLRRRGVGQALAQRVRVVLACAEPGATNLGVARALGVSRQTVATWRGRFAEHRLEGLVDAPRSGAPRSIGDEAVERLVALTLEEAPRGATHWSTRSMARRAGMSQTAVSRDLARLRPAAAPHRDLQALLRPGLRGQGARRGRPLPGPAGARAGAVRGREAPDPGGPGHGAGVPHAARASPSGAPTTTGGTARSTCSPRST